MTREELIAKVEGLADGDREVDVETKRFLYPDSNSWLDHKAAHLYTSSVDAVLALIQERLPGWRIWECRQMASRDKWHCSLIRDDQQKATGYAATAALALFAAALRADQAALAPREAGSE